MKKAIIFILSISVLISLCACADVQHGNSVESINQEPSSSINQGSKTLNSISNNKDYNGNIQSKRSGILI